MSTGYPKLEKSREIEKLNVAVVARLLNDVNQGKVIIQSMVFEPSNLVLHQSIGRGPTTLRATSIALAALSLRCLSTRPRAKSNVGCIG